MIRWLREHYVPIDAMGIILATGFALFAGVVAYVQFTTQWRLEHERQAKAAYQEFLKISLQYPHLAKPSLMAGKETPENDERYFWYVGLMNQTFEQVFEFIPDEEAWVFIAEGQFRLHCAWYALSKDYRPEHYSDRFNAAVDAAIEEGGEACK